MIQSIGYPSIAQLSSIVREDDAAEELAENVLKALHDAAAEIDRLGKHLLAAEIRKAEFAAVAMQQAYEQKLEDARRLTRRERGCTRKLRFYNGLRRFAGLAAA